MAIAITEQFNSNLTARRHIQINHTIATHTHIHIYIYIYIYKYIYIYIYYIHTRTNNSI